LWRLSFPEVVEDNDRLADLHRVANYLAGAKLPPIDYWLPYQRFNYYYTFQHYSAALLGRLFGLGPGESFTLAPIILPALVLGLAWEFLTLVRVRLWAKLLSIAALAIGGTGISPLLHFVASPSSPDFFSYESAVEALIYNSRLLGLFDSSVATGAWQAVFGETPRAVRLPIETFGYQYAIGGYHAVLAGFLLQFLALTIMAAIPRSSKAVRSRLLAGISSETGYMHLAFVSPEAHTPFAQFLVVWWPFLVLVLAVVLFGRRVSFAGFLATIFVALLVFSELVNAPDGLYLDDYVRFNPVLKWWGWIFTGGVFSISALLLASDRRAARVAAAVVLVLVSVFAVDALRYFAFRTHEHAGKIDGMSAYEKDPANARMLRYLVDAPSGIVLERVYDEFPRDTGIYGSFAQKPNVVGIPFLLDVWKRNLTELPALVAKIQSFYAGTLLDAERFLTDHDVRYVVWSIRESKNIDAWKSIMQAVDADYRWMEFSTTPEAHVGLWVLR
jgi:hypothetical protein